MRIATKLGLAEFFATEAAHDERYVTACGPTLNEELKQRYLRRRHNSLVAAHILRRLTDEQEVDMLEFQAAAQTAYDDESPGPIKIIRADERNYDAVLIYGPAGSGKSSHAKEFKKHFRMKRVIDCGGENLSYFQHTEPGDLVLTQCMPLKTREGLLVLTIFDALKRLGK